MEETKTFIKNYEIQSGRAKRTVASGKKSLGNNFLI